MYTSGMLTDSDVLRAILKSESHATTLVGIEHAFTRTRWIASDDIVGIMELADFFEVGRSTISNWAAQRDRNGMPFPLKQLGSGPVYSLLEVIRWWVNWVPGKGAKAGKLPITVETEGFQTCQETRSDQGIST